MRIVHVIAGYGPRRGGSEVHVQKISEGLARRGHDVTVLTMLEPQAGAALPSSRSELINSVRVLRFSENTAFEQLLKLRGAHRLLRAVAPAHRVRMMSRGPLSARLFMELLRCEADLVG